MVFDRIYYIAQELNTVASTSPLQKSLQLKCRYFGNDGVGNNRGPNYKDVIRFDGADWDIYDIHIIGRRELYMIRAEARDDLTTVDHIANPAPTS